MTKIKEAVDNHKNYEKFHVATIVAHNGVLVDIVISASYEETKFDKSWQTVSVKKNVSVNDVEKN